MEIRKLRPADDRTAFRSGDETLDRFFRQYAGQNQFRHSIAVTYVAVESGQPFGFATVSAGEIPASALSEEAAKKVPRYPLPILRLGRLAVDSRRQGAGIGQRLLRFVFGLAAMMATEIGCIGIAVDAKPQAVRFYERHGFTVLPVNERQPPEHPVTMIVLLGSIAKAMQPPRLN